MHEFWWFGLKQAYACLFGGFLLAMMVVTRYWYPLEGLHRYDFIFLAAIAFQLLLLLTRLESPRECVVIIVFHLLATLMELFKTSEAIGSWHYPEAWVFGIGNVPLFTGFMYSAVGSYIARAWRVFDFQYAHYPPKAATLMLVLLIYLNFFSHHFIADIRWLLLAATVWLFYRSRVYFRVLKTHRHMPLLLGWLLVALFIWLAENIATYTHVWVYPDQSNGWQMVPSTKLVAWYLLMLLSFVLVSLVSEIRLRAPEPISRPGKRSWTQVSRPSRWKNQR
ncbi:hypothetical protein UN63_14845 [Oceanisphaera arctica]|uniref:DUF817 domain-containing protein n=1 Tax=Oceanisphaera arctica TaxID=641510 RepID=A0A2P5TIU9_9GAMM|nr:hypothetical protein UN63_14845 [Oceanisphaera arctica]